VVERTLGWLNKCRRLSKDYERHTQHSEAMIRVASIHLMMRRLTLKHASHTRSQLDFIHFQAT
jgi:hypothetical protein